MCECRTIARSPTGSFSGMADRQEVERMVKVAAIREAKVRRGDRGDEPRVESLGQPQGRMDAIPAGAKGELVRAQLAGVKNAQDLDPAEMRVEQLAVLGQGVLAKMPRILGLLGARRGQREPVRRRDVGKR